MKEIVPNYYHKFQCIGGQCKHSCCIGWEIDIDDTTMEFYHSLEGAFAEKIRENIQGDVPHFVMTEGGRCPFLNKQGLCDMILKLGEDALCDICYLHPRFSNFYEDFTETGLGLCCEEAVRIILTEKEKFDIPLPESYENVEFFRERNAVFDCLQNRNCSILERFQILAGRYGVPFEFSNEELYHFYLSLERLDNSWDNELKKLRHKKDIFVFQQEELQMIFEQLACYFIFRHFQNGVFFTLLSCWVLGQIFSSCESIEEMLDIVRMYSSEIEYSEENIEKINALNTYQ